MSASPEYRAAQEADARYVESMSLKCLGGGATAPCCPICPEVHPICHFEPGSLCCVALSCGNPHCRRPFRVLVTGSRDWTHRAVVESSLDSLLRRHERLVVVHGACPRGADRYADDWAVRAGVSVERHPADWSAGRGGGPARNAEMVRAGIDLCLAFIRDGSRGATHCAELAEAAGIKTERTTEGATP